MCITGETIYLSANEGVNIEYFQQWLQPLYMLWKRILKQGFPKEKSS